MEQKKGLFRFLLFPFTFVYGLVVFVRNRLFDYNILKSREFNIPIISVGNITVGGTGKTPHIEYLVKVLQKEFELAVLSRGYKRKSKGYLLAGENSTYAEIGDEPLQIKQKFPDIEVAVDRNRKHGIEQLFLENKDLQAILLDDAYQHRYVKPGLSILLIDFNFPISHDHLLPMGKLREPSSERKRADIIILTKTPADLKPIDRRIIDKTMKLYPYQTLYFTTVQYHEPVALSASNNFVPTTAWIKENEATLLLVTGIAQPEPLKKYLLNFTPNISTLYFTDHHEYTEKDLQKIKQTFQNLKGENKIIITTEKDAMRLNKFCDSEKDLIENMFFIPIEIKFLHDEGEMFNEHIIGYVRKNKRDSILYS
ncbi:MAG: tetraacyldisaccharide 4'-kinase [Bacteroidota bacterium]|nr:tetraacyldisaccharide 4'-kinase [Bacteroidota bacterium]